MITRLFETLGKFYQVFSDRKYYNLSYSQEGEDMILRKYFFDKVTGFYIDIGAHHPKRFSNTYMFYKLGWRGINIDAMPGSMKLFKETRRRDINIEKAVSNIDSELTYFVFDDPALNGFSEEISKERNTNTPYKIIKEINIKTEKLSSILEAYLPANVVEIDFMSIDVEGLDLEVLESNNWQKFRPKYIWIELLNFESFDSDPIFIFLCNNGYKFEAKAFYSFLFSDATIP